MTRTECCKTAPTTASNAWGAPTAFAARLASRILKILFSPRTEWGVVASEPTSVAELYAKYVMPLALPAALMGFRMPIRIGLASLMLFVSALFGVFIVGLIINVLAPTFAGRRDPRQAFKAAAYSLTPAGLSSVFAPAPPMLAAPLQLLAALYCAYLLYLGLPVLMRSTPRQAFGYAASVVICTVLVGVVFAVLSAVFPGPQPK